ARFIAAAVRALDKYRNRTVRVLLDGDREFCIRTNLLVAANGRFAGGGMMLAPNALLDDGLLDVVLTDRATRLDVIRELRRVQRGGYMKNPKVSWTRARTVMIESDAGKSPPEGGTTSPDNSPPEGGTTSPDNPPPEGGTTSSENPRPEGGTTSSEN